MVIVEDGTGCVDAESYISVADATAYHAARGNAAWAALVSDTVREQLLRKATEYIEQIYRDQWAGYRMTAQQALSWPRYAVPIKDAPGGYASLPSYYPDKTVPAQVAQACAALALKASSGELAPDLERAVVREKIGPIETEYDRQSPQNRRYIAIERMLAPFLKSGGGSISLVRA